MFSDLRGTRWGEPELEPGYVVAHLTLARHVLALHNKVRNCRNQENQQNKNNEHEGYD